MTEHNGQETEKLKKQMIVQAADKASEILVNMQRRGSSYIHPVVIDADQRGELQASLFRDRMRTGLTTIEGALMRFLQASRSGPGETRN